MYPIPFSHRSKTATDGPSLDARIFLYWAIPISPDVSIDRKERLSRNLSSATPQGVLSFITMILRKRKYFHHGAYLHLTKSDTVCIFDP